MPDQTTTAMSPDDALESLIEAGARAAVDGNSGAGEPVEAPVEEAPVGASGHPTGYEAISEYAGGQINSRDVFASENIDLKERYQATPTYAVKLAEVAKFFKAMKKGRLGMRDLEQAMTYGMAVKPIGETMMSSEFSALLGDTIDRILLAKWATYQPAYRQYMRERRVRDFRAVTSVRLSRGTRLQQVPEGTTYPQGAVSESSYTLSVKKYGKTYEITWEMIQNDDLEAFTELPMDMAEDAIQTESYLAASLYVANGTLFSTSHSHNGSTYSNKGTGALTIANIETAWNQMVKFPGDNDTPLNNTPAFLVVSPSLWLKASRELGVLAAANGDISAPEYPVLVGVTNVLANGRLNIVIDPYIPIIDTTNGHTSWYLFSDPNRLAAAEYAYLRGYEQPQVFMRMPNAMRMGGGEAMVDFDRDSRGYKVRHVFGGSNTNAAGGWRGCYWSDGTA